MWLFQECKGNILESLGNEITAKIVLNSKISYVKEIPRITYILNTKRSFPSHIVIKLSEVKNSENNVKSHKYSTMKLPTGFRQSSSSKS